MAYTLSNILPAEICDRISQYADLTPGPTRQRVLQSIRLFGAIDLEECGSRQIVFADLRDAYSLIKRGGDPWTMGYENFADPNDGMYMPELVAFFEHDGY
jgi:hypothetical protein